MVTDALDRPRGAGCHEDGVTGPRHPLLPPVAPGNPDRMRKWRSLTFSLSGVNETQGSASPSMYCIYVVHGILVFDGDEPAARA